MRPLQEQTILVTGATAGLGRELARELVKRGATVLVHGRDQARIEQTVDELAQASSPDRVVALRADLASLGEVRQLADEVSARGRLDTLVNNAGIAQPERRESADGHELTFAVNYLAPFLLTSRLLPLLRRDPPARVVNVASVGQAPVNFDDVMLEQRYDMGLAYSQSKLALIAFTIELAERLRAENDSGLTVNALHPATLMPTKLVLENIGRTQDSLEQGLKATLRLVVDPDLDQVRGEYFDGTERATALSQAYDAGARAQLWELSEQLCGLSGS